ncbi:MAG: hypothetical protein GY856_19760, partial [bacterium]|nr:hypothetical protein [bacterium]
MESTGSSSDAILKLLREILLGELSRHDPYRHDAHYLSSHIWDWEWLTEPPTFMCKVPTLDSYRRFTVHIELPVRGRPLRVRCGCLPPDAGGSPFAHAQRCRHTCAALMYLESYLLSGDRPADRRMVEFSREELAAWNSTASILDGFLAEQAAAACPVDR